MPNALSTFTFRVDIGWVGISPQLQCIPDLGQFQYSFNWSICRCKRCAYFRLCLYSQPRSSCYFLQHQTMVYWCRFGGQGFGAHWHGRQYWWWNGPFGRCIFGVYVCPATVQRQRYWFWLYQIEERYYCPFQTKRKESTHENGLQEKTSSSRKADYDKQAKQKR